MQLTKPIKQYYKIALGVFFVILGFIGLFLPILQGILFLAIGVALLVNHSPTFKRIWNHLGSRFPRLLVLTKTKEKGKEI